MKTSFPTKQSELKTAITLVALLNYMHTYKKDITIQASGLSPRIKYSVRWLILWYGASHLNESFIKFSWSRNNLTTGCKCYAWKITTLKACIQLIRQRGEKEKAPNNETIYGEKRMLTRYMHKRKYKEPENIVCFSGGFFMVVTKAVIFKSTWPRCCFMWTDFTGLYRHQKLCYRCRWLYPSSSSASSSSPFVECIFYVHHEVTYRLHTQTERASFWNWMLAQPSIIL